MYYSLIDLHFIKKLCFNLFKWNSNYKFLILICFSALLIQSNDRDLQSKNNPDYYKKNITKIKKNYPVFNKEQN